MKNVFVFCTLLFVVISGKAQNYRPFDGGSTHVFSETLVPVHTFCLAADSVTKSGTDSLYYFYTQLSDSIIESDSCTFWGGNQCALQDEPVWSGRKAVGRPGGQFLFFNVAGDTLKFRFDMTPGDTSVILSTPSERFLLTCTGYSWASFLGFNDSVKEFRVIHTDLFGQAIASAIHQQPVTIGKTLGLVNFIRVDFFPQVLTPLTLIGHPGEQLGMYNITEGMIFDHQPGDVIQTRYQHFANPGPPWENYVRYTKSSFLSRTDQPGLRTYTVATETFRVDSAEIHYDTITRNYFPDRIAIAAPFDRLNAESLVYNSVYFGDYDGMNLLTYHTEPGHLAYCAPDNCWGPTDTFGPPPDEWTTFVCELGIWNQHYLEWQPGVSSWGFDEQLVYFRRGGIAIGGEFFVGTENPATTKKTMKITPNPATDETKISFSAAIDGRLVVSDLNGRALITQSVSGTNSILNVSRIAAGTYLILVTTGNKFQAAKLIKQ